MSRETYQVAIDVGSNSIKLCVVKESPEGNDKLQVICLIEGESSGIKKGVVTNMSEATQSLIEIINQAETIIGLPIKSAVIGINSPSISFVNSEGMTIISATDNEIRDSDVNRVVDDSSRKAFGVQNTEMIHLITKSFSVDNQHGIKYPVGMVGSKLEVKTLIITCDNSFLRNFSKVFEQSDIKILNTIFTPLASSDYILTSRQKKAGSILIDMGYASTSYIVLENEEVVYSSIIPVGSDHITSDLAVGLQTNIEMAEEIKKQYLTLTRLDDENESIEIYNPDLQINEKFKLSEIQQYAKPRVEEIFMLISRDLKKISKNSMPGGCVLIGGGSSLIGIDEVARQVLKLNTFRYVFDLNTIDFIPDYNNDPAFINCISLAMYSYHNQEDTSPKKPKFLNAKNSGTAISSLWENIKKFLPF